MPTKPGTKPGTKLRTPLRSKSPIIAKIFDKVMVDDGCWRVKCFHDRDGYARLGNYYGSDILHHALYELLIGPVPPGMVPDHLCKNRWCVNPYHLEIVTPGENARRGVKGNKGWQQRARTHCPEGHPLEAPNLIASKPNGYRECRTCHNRRCLERYHKTKKLKANG